MSLTQSLDTFSAGGQAWVLFIKGDQEEDKGKHRKMRTSDLYRKLGRVKPKDTEMYTRGK